MADFTRPPTAQAAVLAELRARILDGRLPPGAALRQEELSTQLGVSRVPVREALRMLEAEGHVTYAAHRGYRVVHLEIADLEEIYHLRALIEDDLIRRTARAWSDDDLATIRHAFGELSRIESAIDPDPLALAAANRRFHAAILRPGPRTERILATLWDASEAHRARWFASPENVARGAHEHARALAAVQAGDAEALVAILAEHRAGAIAALRPLLASGPPQVDESTG